MGQTRNAELKDRLREALDFNNMRPIELSEKTGIPKSMVSYYLSGKSKPKADRIYDICKVLDVNEAWLMGYDVPMQKNEQNKKNDTIVGVVSMLRSDPEFFELVSMMAELTPDQRASLKPVILMLNK